MNSYFQTKLNIPYERYLFKCLNQKEGETSEQFVTRLRQRAATCAFQNADESIRDQVIEKCRSPKIRARLLEKGDDLTLDQLRTIAATIELTESQTRQMTQAPQLSSQHGGIHVLSNRRQSSSSSQRERMDSRRQQGAARRPGPECYRCGREEHLAKDAHCPAKDKTCNKCKKRDTLRNAASQKM
ncbi:uncharacterized protein [Diadema antillarum]|uniref:uncharacterized protein n=1 Tax=Diadema antillarum TaxID=105358 RepID=UPI003A84F326